MKNATNYKARPGDGIRGVFIFLDKKVLSVYNMLKGMLGINDDAVSKLLGTFRKKK